LGKHGKVKKRRKHVKKKEERGKIRGKLKGYKRFFVFRGGGWPPENTCLLGPNRYEYY
jgi:hypothetical protein